MSHFGGYVWEFHKKCRNLGVTGVVDQLFSHNLRTRVPTAPTVAVSTGPPGAILTMGPPPHLAALERCGVNKSSRNFGITYISRKFTKIS